MKKIVVFTITAVAALIVAPNVDAQAPPTAPSPELCAESDGLTPDEILLCSGVDDDGVGIDIYPIPPTTTSTTVPPTTVPGTTTTTIGVIPPTLPPTIPATGSSGTSGILQLGALILTGGLLVVIAARRRSEASTAVA